MLRNNILLPGVCGLIFSAVVIAGEQNVSANRSSYPDTTTAEVDSSAFGNYYELEERSSMQEIIREVGEPVGSSKYIPRQPDHSLPAEQAEFTQQFD